jgi:hypothetical protein
MKFRVTFKSPDAVYDAIHEAVQSTIPEGVKFIESDLNDELDDKRQELKDFAKKWVRYDEYVTVEFDTDAKTCTVMEAK